MKTVEAYLTLPFTIEVSFDGENYIASDTEMKDCIGTASSCEEAISLVMQKRKDCLQKMLAEYEEMLKTLGNT